MVLLIIIPIKWLFHWEYTLFSDKAKSVRVPIRPYPKGSERRNPCSGLYPLPQTGHSNCMECGYPSHPEPLFLSMFCGARRAVTKSKSNFQLKAVTCRILIAPCSDGSICRNGSTCLLLCGLSLLHVLELIFNLAAVHLLKVLKLVLDGRAVATRIWITPGHNRSICQKCSKCPLCGL